jgi:hypothetical protein
MEPPWPELSEYRPRPKFAALSSIVCILCLLLFVATKTLHPQDSIGLAIGVKTVPKDYSGPCPTIVQFQATIMGGDSKVKYHWERGNGKSTPEHSGKLSDGKLDVSDKFSIGVSGHTFLATDRLHVVFEGNTKELVSPKIEIKGTCVQ